MRVYVPYDDRTGQVYLNSIADTEEDAMDPIFKGCFEIPEEDMEHIVCATADLMEGAGSDETFPVVIPVGIDGKPVAKCIGSNREEALANLDFSGIAPDDVLLIDGHLLMHGFELKSLPSP